MKLVFLYVGATDRGYLSEGIDLYINRIKYYVSVEEQVIREEKAWKNLDSSARSMAEGKAIAAALQPSDDVILLDAKGKSFTSIGFATFLQKRLNVGAKRLVFIVGGAYGFSSALRKEFPLHVSLSMMTFSHQMIRLLLAEQVYRALTILKNEPYHNE